MPTSPLFSPVPRSPNDGTAYFSIVEGMVDSCVDDVDIFQGPASDFDRQSNESQEQKQTAHNQPIYVTYILESEPAASALIEAP